MGEGAVNEATGRLVVHMEFAGRRWLLPKNIFRVPEEENPRAHNRFMTERRNKQTLGWTMGRRCLVREACDEVVEWLATSRVLVFPRSVCSASAAEKAASGPPEVSGFFEPTARRTNFRAPVIITSLDLGCPRS